MFDRTNDFSLVDTSIPGPITRHQDRCSRPSTKRMMCRKNRQYRMASRTFSFALFRPRVLQALRACLLCVCFFVGRHLQVDWSPNVLSIILCRRRRGGETPLPLLYRPPLPLREDGDVPPLPSASLPGGHPTGLPSPSTDGRRPPREGGRRPPLPATCQWRPRHGRGREATSPRCPTRRGSPTADGCAWTAGPHLVPLCSSASSVAPS